jgi:hypothetical protein
VIVVTEAAGTLARTNRAGQEIGRAIGLAEWDTPEIAEFLKPIISKQIDPMERAVVSKRHMSINVMRP